MTDDEGITIRLTKDEQIVLMMLTGLGFVAITNILDDKPFDTKDKFVAEMLLSSKGLEHAKSVSKKILRNVVRPKFSGN